MNVVTAKAKYYVVRAGNVYGMFLGSRSIRHSQIAVHYVWKQETGPATIYRIYSPNRTAISKFYKGSLSKFGSGDYSYYSDLLESLTYIEFDSNSNYQAMNLMDLDSEGLVKEMKKLDEADFVHWLRTDKGQTLEEVKDFKIDPTKYKSEEHGVVDFHGASILIDPSVKEDKQKEIFGYIDTVRKRLESHGFGHLYPGDIVVAPLASKMAGWYFQSSKEMHIDPAKSKEIVEVLYHEYAHKLHHLFLTAEQKKLIKDTYEAEISNTHNKEDYVKHLKKVTGKGKKILFKSDNFAKDQSGKVLLIKRFAQRIEVYKDGPNTPGRNGTMLFPYERINQMLFMPDGSNIPEYKPTNSTNLFPTAYSKTDDEEWFAECFAYFLMDKAHKDIGDFLNKLFGMAKDK